ncbi:DgyrCDS4364 [Dimorphilus gyrociliatus]|uniref:DgyrCDS4364 n=1 Tax=Dimorphilus gyrociliatus TaxID=2664684 RepID=A0A7I8VLF7_9ANNE|nr:DgyrCDS4364 [Dimorphilus gyrociliatus]
MTDRKKLPTTDNQGDIDKQFLEKSGTNLLIRGAILKLIQNQPENPINYLVEYFENAAEKSNKVNKAFQMIKQTPYNEEAFKINVRDSYEMLMSHKSSKTSITKGVTGISYTEILQLLCMQASQQYTEKLLRKIYCREAEYIPFHVFRDGVFLACVFIDHVERSQKLFENLDKENTGQIDRAIGDALFRQLQGAVSRKPDDVLGLVEACYELGPNKIYDIVQRVSITIYNTFFINVFIK